MFTIVPIFVEFMQLLSAIQSWKFEKPVFYGFWGFLQLGVEGETSNIAYVTLAVHTFAGKKEFFKSAQYFSLLSGANKQTNTQTNTHTHTHTYVTKFKYCYL